MQYFIHRNNQQLGPFTEAEVKAQLAAGTISEQDHVWWQGQSGWVPLGQSSLMTASTLPVPGTPLAAATPADPLVGGVVHPTSKLAIAALVCGCLGFVCSCVATIPAIILGHLALAEIKKTPGMQGRGMALAGTILGYSITTLIIVVYVVILAFGSNVQSVLKTLEAQESATQLTNSTDQSPSSPDQTTNAPDQPAATPTTNSTDQSAPTNSPDMSTNSAPAPTNSPDMDTNSAPQPSTNSPADSTNSASSNSPTATPMNQ